MNPFVRPSGWYGLLMAFAAFCLLNLEVWAASFPPNDDALPNMAVGKNTDGRLEVFQVDARGELRHRWQAKSANEWSSWSTMGSGFFPNVSVINDSQGCLTVFAVDRTTQSIAYNHQNETNYAGWVKWAKLPALAARPELAVGMDRGGQVEVFAVTTNDHSLKRIRQTDDRQGWLEWSDLGATVEPGPVVARNATGQLEVFAIDVRTHELIHCWQIAADKPDEWSAWSSLGETMLPGFAVGPNADGRLEAAGVTAADGTLVHAAQLSAKPDSAWMPWMPLGRQMKPVIAMGRNHDGRIEIFTIDVTNNMIFHTFQFKPGITNWAGLTDMGAATLSYPAVGNNFEGLLEIFAVDEHYAEVLNHRRIISGNLLWTDWVSLDHSRKQYMSRVWRSEDGLPDNRVQAIAQTRDGYLWIGTHKGLTKFDGVRFGAPEREGLGDLAYHSITCLRVDSDGALWIGSDGAGLACLKDSGVTRYTTVDGLAGDSVTSFCDGWDASLWIGTKTGLSRFTKGVFTNYTTKDGLLANAVVSVYEEPSNSNLWVTTVQGVTRINGKTFRSFTQSNGLPVNSLTGIWQDIPSRLWFGSSEGVILLRANRFFAYGPNFGLSDRFVNVILNDSQGTLWVGTTSGLNRFEDGKFLGEAGIQDAHFGKINVLFEDRERNLWAGSQNGLVRLRPKKLLVYDERQGLTRNNITAVAEDSGGSLWIGTSGGGLDQLKDQTIRAYTPAAGFSNDVVSAVCNGRDGSVWAGSDSFGVLTQLKEANITQYKLPGASAGTAINVLLEDRKGNLWIGTSDGLRCMRQGVFITNGAEAQLTGRFVRAICEDQQGGLWFGTDVGLVCSKNGECSTFTAKDGLPDDAVTALYADDQQVLWIGTQKSGLVRFANRAFTAYTTRWGMFSDEIFEILEDDSGCLWMSCSKGIFTVRKTEFTALDQKRLSALNSIAYRHDDGMESVLCSVGKPGGWKTRDGQLWFPTSEGLVVIDAKGMNVNREPPPVYLEQVIANHKPQARRSEGDTDHSPAADIRIPPGAGDLEFDYTALDFQKPERLRFKYRLEGADTGWIDAETRRAAYYNNLPPGDYTFQVIACNDSGVWNEQGASLGIVLMPHFWQKWWFRALLVTLALTVIATIFRVREARRLEIERLRTRIAADLHDDIGSNLASIALLSQLGQEPEKGGSAELTEINKIALFTANGIREIVWFINPECDTLPEMIARMKEVAAQMLTGVEYRFQTPDKPKASRLPLEFRRNVLLAFKEILHNIISHAHARRVDIQVREEGDALVLKVSDDGCGFDINAVRRGNGLRNMRLRIEQLHGRLEIVSSAGKGAAISLEMNIT